MRRDRVECRSCRRQTQPGFLLDTKHQGQFALAHWVSGAPEHSFWSGLKLKGRTRLPVTVYRCDRCGLLEAYALPPE